MFYPNIKDETIESMNLVLRSMAQDPEYLNDPACRYSERMKDFFRNLTAVAAAEPGPFGLEGEDEDEAIDAQIKRVLNDLERMSATMANAETTEKLNYYKTKASLTEKLISMRERVYNLRELSQFRGTILASLEDICTKDQITTFMLRLEGTMGTTSK